MRRKAFFAAPNGVSRRKLLKFTVAVVRLLINRCIRSGFDGMAAAESRGYITLAVDILRTGGFGAERGRFCVSDVRE